VRGNDPLQSTSWNVFVADRMRTGGEGREGKERKQLDNDSKKKSKKRKKE
jgi:hypothetical protein